MTYSLKSLEGRLLLVGTILASGMAFLDGTVVNIAIPTMQSHFHASLGDIQWIINGYALVLTSLLLISGALGDRFGRKKVFLYGIGLFTLASFLCGLSGSITQLIFFRFLQGLGAAMMIPGSLSIINGSFNPEIRGTAIGLWSGFAGGVAALGPFLGGWLVQSLGWQSIFYINIPLGIIAFFITLRFVPETKQKLSQAIDLWGTAYVFLGLFGIVYGLIEGSTLGWTNGSVLISLIFGVVFSVLFIFTELRTEHSLIPLQIFKSRLVTGANLVTLLLYAALSGVIFFLVLDLQQVQHFAPLYAGFAMLPTILLITFLSGPAGALADRIGPRIPMTVGAFLVGIGMTLLTLSGRQVNYFISVMPGLILFGLGMALVIAPLTKSALAVSEYYSGVASGFNNFVSRLAGLLIIVVLTPIMLFVFSTHMKTALKTASLTAVHKQQLVSQVSKVGGIEIPSDFSKTEQQISQTVIENSFVSGFRIVMGINAFLAFLAAGVSWSMIRDEKKPR